MVKVLAVKSKEFHVSTEEFIHENSETHFIVKPGLRTEAITFIKSWIQREAIEYIKICDPYFKSGDLELVKEIYMLKPDLKISILAQFENSENENAAELYKKRWSEICDQEPPEITVLIVGHRNRNKSQIISPNHDRWYITYESGLRVGTSFNSLGITKNAEISIMSTSEARDIEINIIDKYLNRSEKFHNGERLSYMQFDL
jgi:hypothetical protein